MAFSVPMGSRGCAGMLPARRMAWYRTFISSQVASVHLADMDLRDHELRYEYDCSVIKITRTDTTSFLTVRRASGVNLIRVKHRPIYPC